MLPATEIQQYGGKAAILNHVRDKLPHMPILNYIVRQDGSSLGSILPYFQKMRKPIIVRSSSPYEYGDFEGIFDSVRDVYDENSLKAAIEKVEKSATSERTTEYARQNGFKIDFHIHTIIQEQSDSQYCGAMMRHPNNPNLIFITYFSGWGKNTRNYKYFLFNEDGNEHEMKEFMIGEFSSIDEEDAKFLVEKYKEVESLSDIGNDYALFMEFGFKPFAFYQARPFKKIQVADFELPNIHDGTILRSDLCFGITSKDGIVYPVVRSIDTETGYVIVNHIIENERGLSSQKPEVEFDGIEYRLKLGLMNSLYASMFLHKDAIELIRETIRLYNLDVDALAQSPYCFMIPSAQREEYDVDLSVPNMKALVLGEPQNFLVHNLMRLIKKADVSIGAGILLFDDIYQNTISLKDKVRIISNGKEAVVMKE